MKKSKKILLTALSATIATTLTAGLALTSFADEATKDHEYSSKFDAVYEDFDRADLNDTVTTSGAVDLGETPHLHVEFKALTADTPVATRVGQIYKNGSGSIKDVKKGEITIRMRAPEDPVKLSDLYFGVRGASNNDDGEIVVKTMDVVTGKTSTATVSAEWQNYTISFAQAYDPADKYPAGGEVTEIDLQGIHIYAKDGVEGVLDIDYISYGENLYLTEFRGSAELSALKGFDAITASAKCSDVGGWWADSRDGEIVPRQPEMKAGSEMTVKNGAVGKYAYAMIEASGDVGHLKVATTTDGTTWSTAAAYDTEGHSVALNGDETGFKFIYEGEGSVTIKRIYLTNNYVPEPAIAVPVIDAKTAKVLDDFSVAQTGFTGADDMNGRPETEAAGLYYRKSWENGDKIAITGGNLVFDATDPESGLFNFRFQSKSTFEGKYIVLKMKTTDGATLDNFRFRLLDEKDGEIKDFAYANNWKSGYNYKSALLDDSNPYKDGDWYYVVIDIDESGLASREGKYTGMNMYYNGTGKLYFDNIFFCDGKDVEIAAEDKYVEKDIASGSSATFNGSEGYGYVGYISLDNGGYATELTFNLTPTEDDFDPTTLRFELRSPADKKIGEYGASGALVTTDGKKLTELTYVKDKPTTITIDLIASGIVDEFVAAHVHVGYNAEDSSPAVGCKAFKLDNFKIHTSTPIYYAKDVDYTKFDETKTVTVKDELAITPEVGSGYLSSYVGGVDSKVCDVISFTLIPGEGFDGGLIRFTLEAEGGNKTLWLKDYLDVITDDGKKFNEITYAEGVPVNFVIDIAKLGWGNTVIKHVHFETSGADTGSLTVKNFKLNSYAAKDFITPVVEKYYPAKWAEQLALLPVYLDTTDPTVSITTETTATAGDEITIAYTASDDKTATADLDVKVSVTKDGNAVTLTDSKFTAEEGVYTVTVTVRDVAGNEATDTIQITVSAAPSNGLSTGAIVGLVLGCVTAVVVAGVVVLLLLKKKKNN